MNALEQLKQYSIVVADTGEIDLIAIHKPKDATTNPSLLLKAVNKNPDSEIVRDAIAYGNKCGTSDEEKVRYAMDKLAVNIGKQILTHLPDDGRVSTEVPARLSYDTEETFNYAMTLKKLYEESGVDPSKNVLFKIASTWEGIQAAQRLEKIGIHCNLTLLFSVEQAIAAAEAGVTLISPFVGRIRDWYMKSEGRTEPYPTDEDPGVLSVREIYNYFKFHGYDTEIMGASFRGVEEIIGLAGCDLLTIDPKWLDQLESMEVDVPRILSPDTVTEVPKLSLNEIDFRTALSMNPMAYELLGAGIRSFDADAKKLEDLLKSKL